MVTEENVVIQPVKKSTPFLLKVVSVLLLIEGVIGFLFFTVVMVYQYANPEFLSGWGYGHYSGSALYLILSIYSMVHLGLILSAFLILNRKKQGIYILTLSLFVLEILSFLLYDEVNWVGLAAGLTIIVVMLLFWKSFE